ncbi:hypothetical protein ABN028_17465 [Actinopolymorpha sp. B17G11]|uniref:hypothetical protein n=1 Tax=unclassified Actinopolymorpha TaxID=2627063 RepID=UPI0032D912B5
MSTGALGRRVWGDDLPVRVSGTLATYVLLRPRKLLGFSILDRIRHQRVAAVERLLKGFPRPTTQNLVSPATQASYRPTCRARIS